MKRFGLSLLLTVLMSMVGIQVSAHDFAVDGFYYRYIDNQTAVAVTYRGDGNDEYSGNVYSGSLTIPSTVKYNGTTYPVKMIDDDAFAYCRNLTSITIRNSVTSIGSKAFYNCSGLTTITIPTSVTSIGEQAFYNTLWFNNKSDGVIYINNLLYTYKGTVVPQSITVKTGTTSICGGAFSGRSGLKSIVIPNSLTTVGNMAFYGCTGLTSFTANSLTTIGNMAFYGCTGLTSFTANSLTTIGDEAFQNCIYFEDFTIPNTVTSIGSWAFNNSGLSSVTIPNSVTSIGRCAFATGGLQSISVEQGNMIYDSRDNCNAIVETATNTMIAGCVNTVIPSTVTSLVGAFSECAGLRHIEIPNSVTLIGDYAFCHSSVGPIEIPNSVTRIGSSAFKECGGLSSITIPASVSRIDSWAFDECNFLTSVTVEREQPAYLGTSVFDSDLYSNRTLYVPSGCRVTYGQSSWNRYFHNIEEVQTQKDLSSSDVTIAPIGAVIFNGSDQYPDVTVKDGSTTLTSGTDYTIAYSNNTNAGTATVTITGMGNYIGTKSATFTINPKNASNLTISSISAVTYNGSAQTPAVTVMDNPSSYNSDDCFSDSYIYDGITKIFSNTNNIDISIKNLRYKDNTCNSTMCCVVVKTPSGKEYILDSRNLFDPDRLGAYCVSKNGYTYVNLQAKEAGIWHLLLVQQNAGDWSYSIPNAVTLIKGTDYTVSYSNNTNAGTATVTITGKGNYTGTKTADFTINKASLTVTAKSYTITQGNPLPTFECTYSGFKNGETASALTTLPTISCSATSNSAPGTYDIIASGGSATNYAFNYVKGTLTIEAYVNNIQFADNTVKSICVANWDTSGDGELSEAEAAAVTDIGTAFKSNTSITSFNELRYFTGLTSIGSSAFSGCNGLTSIDIPNSVTSIASHTFYICSGLTSITIPNSVTSIGSYAFCGCSGLTSVTIGNSVTSIGEAAFYGCSGLTSITIGNSVTSIGNYAFLSCSGLTSITIPNSVTSIGYDAFGGCSGLTSIIVEEGNSIYDSRDNCNAIIETASNKLIAGCKNSVIPNTVTSIGDYAFRGCNGLTSVTIPNSVTSIGNYAFRDCSGLTNVIIPNSVISIGGAAFWYCRLTSMVVDNVSPPTAEDLLFDSQFSYPTLYVPKNSKAAFQVADSWSAMHFKAIKEFPDPDVNQDGTVNVVDVVDIARFVVGTPRNAFVEFLADLNNSGGVNVADAVVLVNEIAGDTQFARQLRAPEQTGSDVLTLCSVDDTRLSFRLDGSGRYAAFQFDLWLPSDVDVMQLSLNNERSQGHQLLYNKVGDSHYRVVALSASGSAFNGASGELLGLTFDGLATDEVGIDNIHFVTTNGTDVPFDALGVTVSSEVTAIRSAENSSEGAQPAYNLNGQRLESPRKGLNIIGGKKIVVK